MTEKTTPEGDAVESAETQETQEETNENSSSSTEETIDYETLARQEEERVRKPDPELAAKAFKERQEKKQSTESTDEDDKPLTRREVEALLAHNTIQTQKQLQESLALETARKFTSSEAEAKAVVTYYKSRIIPTGNLEEDIKFAVGGLNYGRISSKNRELSRALKNKDSVSKDGATTHRDAPEGSEPKLSPNDSFAIKQAGFQWDGTKRMWKKPLAGGKKFLYKRNLKDAGFME